MEVKKKETKIERLQRYQNEGRGEWWFYPLWKKILYVITFPFIMLWLCLCWCIMKIGKCIFMIGDWMSGCSWNGGNWMEDV